MTKVGEFLLTEPRPDFFVHLVGGMRVRDERHRLRPLEGRAFPRGIVRILAPGVERVEALLILTDRAEILPVHVETVGTAVHLRGAQLY